MAVTKVLGISAFYHDSAATILVDGEIIAAAQEERFSRKKNDSDFPNKAIAYVLHESGLDFSDLDAIIFYDKPLLKFERILETHHAFVPKGIKSFVTSIPIWIKEKLFMKKFIRKQLKQFGNTIPPLLFSEHHLSHAASAYYPSPFKEAAILTIDGVGEWSTTTISFGDKNGIRVLKELHFPHSIGLLYSAFTYYLGFKVNGGEYKLMGLASYGHQQSLRTKTICDNILTKMVDVREDGSILLNMDYFSFATKLTMTNDQKWEKLLGISRRKPEAEITQEHMDLALAAQLITESIILDLVRTTKKITNCDCLTMAGGVALNCVANSKIVESGIFDKVWIQPAPGDAGGALGAAYVAHHIYFGNKKPMVRSFDLMKHSHLGPEYSNKEIKRILTGFNASYRYFNEFGELSALVSEELAQGKIVGWFQGRMEFGPRALGNRSILADPRNPKTQNLLNKKIKYRESFRPFAPSVLLEDVSKHFSTNKESPYMLFVGKLKKELQKTEPEEYQNYNIKDRLNHIRSSIPAVTHVDYSARIQTVSKHTNPLFWQLIHDFKKITGLGMLVNTSFNVRGEPIVCSPKDAYHGFMNTEMDYLVMGNYLLERTKQKNST